MIVKPKKGLLVKDPVTLQYLPEKGKRVTDNSFWRRRLRDGDVEEVVQKSIETKIDDSKKSKK